MHTSAPTLAHPELVIVHKNRARRGVINAKTAYTEKRVHNILSPSLTLLTSNIQCVRHSPNTVRLPQTQSGQGRYSSDVGRCRWRPTDFCSAVSLRTRRPLQEVAHTLRKYATRHTGKSHVLSLQWRGKGVCWLRGNTLGCCPNSLWPCPDTCWARTVAPWSGPDIPCSTQGRPPTRPGAATGPPPPPLSLPSRPSAPLVVSTSNIGARAATCVVSNTFPAKTMTLLTLLVQNKFLVLCYTAVSVH